jgi:hypothetical protein
MLSARAGRWVTEQVGRHARTVKEIAVELGCDGHTINDTVVAYGTALVEQKDRFGTVEALGLDEVLFARIGPWHRQEFSTPFGRGAHADFAARLALEPKGGRRCYVPIRSKCAWGLPGHRDGDGPASAHRRRFAGVGGRHLSCSVSRRPEDGD